MVFVFAYIIVGLLVALYSERVEKNWHDFETEEISNAPTYIDRVGEEPFMYLAGFILAVLIWPWALYVKMHDDRLLNTYLEEDIS